MFTSDLQVQVEKALRKGHVLTDITTCLATGAPGSGKTHLRYLLYGLFPPDVRISTACIEEAKRAIISSLDFEESQWKPVPSGGLKEIVAEGLSAGVDGLEDQISSVAPQRADIAHLKPNAIIQVHDPIIHVQDTGNQVQDASASHEQQSQPTTDTTAPTSQASAHTIQEGVGKDSSRIEAFKLPETADIIRLMKSLASSKQPL